VKVCKYERVCVNVKDFVRACVCEVERKKEKGKKLLPSSCTRIFLL